MTDQTGCHGFAHRAWWFAYDLLGFLPTALQRGPVHLVQRWVFNRAAATCNWQDPNTDGEDPSGAASDTNAADQPDLDGS